MLTRGGHDWTERFPTVAAAAARLPVRSALLDGKIVALEPSGASSFARLKATLAGEARDALVCYVFDLLFHDGVDLRGLPLADRKRQLEAILDPRDAGAAIRLSEHVAGDGGLIRREACRLGTEGILAKRADAPYRSGRSDAWLKIKCRAGRGW